MSDYNLERVLHNFDYAQLARVCSMHEQEFAEKFKMEEYVCGEQTKWDDYDPFYAFKDNGSSVLAVAHLDTVVDHKRRKATFVDTEDGPVVHSGALDDRLGAYTILMLLPIIGINVDVLLTTGEESGQSTGDCFDPPREYHWMIEFDRGGTDVVLYQYEDEETKQLVRDAGARVGVGIFSDISYMEHLEIKGFNWGVGYQDYHGPRSHAYLIDYWTMIGRYLDFHESNHDVYLPHDKVVARAHALGAAWSGGTAGVAWTSEDFEQDEDFRSYLRKMDAEAEANEAADAEVSEDFEKVNQFCLDEQVRAVN